MLYSRQAVVEMLRNAGFRDAANEAEADLPDPVDLDTAAEWGLKRGISRSILISRMGGSP